MLFDSFKLNNLLEKFSKNSQFLAFEKGLALSGLGGLGGFGGGYGGGGGGGGGFGGIGGYGKRR